MVKCYKCQKDTGYQASDTIMRGDDCDQCGADMRSCMMCVFFNKASYNECKEPMADRIIDKEKKNFCDYFQFGNNQDLSNQKDDLLSKANSLFK